MLADKFADTSASCEGVLASGMEGEERAGVRGRGREGDAMEGSLLYLKMLEVVDVWLKKIKKIN